MMMMVVVVMLQVVYTTCSGAGSLPLKTYRFKRLLIDEAAQACEPSCLVPLSRGAETICFIGDDKQLPPLVKAFDAAELKTSLFERSVTSNNDQPLCVLYLANNIRERSK